MKPNHMKEKIARGEPAFGVSVMFPSPQVVEMLGYAGFDWVLIDCEHGAIGLATVELMAMAATLPASRRSRARAGIPRATFKGHGPRRHGRAGAARQYGRGRTRAVAAVKFGPGASAAWRRGRGPTAGGSGRACPTSRRPRTRNRSSASSSNTRRRSATSMRSSRSRASTCSSSAPRTCRSRWAFPAIRRRRRSPRRSRARSPPSSPLAARPACRPPPRPWRRRRQGLPLYLHAPAAAPRRGRRRVPQRQAIEAGESGHVRTHHAEEQSQGPRPQDRDPGRAAVRRAAAALQRRAGPGALGHPPAPRDRRAPSRPAVVGADPRLDQGGLAQAQAHQRHGRAGRVGADVPRRLRQAPLPAADRQFLRVGRRQGKGPSSPMRSP